MSQIIFINIINIFINIYKLYLYLFIYLYIFIFFLQNYLDFPGIMNFNFFQGT